MTIRVLLADDHGLLRAGLGVLLASEPDLELAGEASTGREAAELAAEMHPDVVVMDIRMPDMDGITATRLITQSESFSSVRVLILTTFEIDEYVFDALLAGASGFLGKASGPDELLDGIRTVASGDALLSPRATKSLIAHFLARPGHPGRATPEQLATLTDRERQVLTLVAGGMSNDEIADNLVVSPATVKTHVNRAMTKLGARDRAQLVVLAYQTGLVRVSNQGNQ
jgi:DNA-binding NarL/FixJ family response regulator